MNGCLCGEKRDLAGQMLAIEFRQVGHLLGIGDEFLIDPVAYLLAPILRPVPAHGSSVENVGCGREKVDLVRNDGL